MTVISRRNALITSHLREESRYSKDIRIETGYHWKKSSYSKHSSHNKNNVINNKTVMNRDRN